MQFLKENTVILLSWALISWILWTFQSTFWVLTTVSLSILSSTSLSPLVSWKFYSVPVWDNNVWLYIWLYMWLYMWLCIWLYIWLHVWLHKWLYIWLYIYFTFCMLSSMVYSSSLQMVRYLLTWLRNSGVSTTSSWEKCRCRLSILQAGFNGTRQSLC